MRKALRKNYKRIIGIIFLIVILSSTFIENFNIIYAKTNTIYETSGEAGTIDVEQAVSESTILDGVARFVYAMAGFVENIVSGIVGSVTGGESLFPWADRVVFNTISFLDVNFLNPENGSLFRKKGGDDTTLGNIIRNLYFTIFTLAISFFGVVVGIMALKLAISSIASEKAKYKKAIQNWLLALILIFCAHYLMSFVFFINEKMVEAASGILMAQKIDVSIKTSGYSDSEKTDIVTAIMKNWSGGGVFSYDEYRAPIYFSTTDEPDGTVYAIGLNKKLHTIKGYHSIDTWKELQSNKNSYVYKGVNWDKMNSRKDSSLGMQWELNVLKLLENADYNHTHNGKTDDIDIEDEDSIYVLMVDAAYVTLLQNEAPEILKDESLFKTGIKNLKNRINKTGYKVNYDLSGWPLSAGDLDSHFNSLWNAANTLNDANEDVESEVFSGIAEFFKNTIYVVRLTEDDEGDLKVKNFNAIPAILYSIFVIQSIMYFIAYLKRFFYIIGLALFAPLVIIYDFLSKTIAT